MKKDMAWLNRMGACGYRVVTRVCPKPWLFISHPFKECSEIEISRALVDAVVRSKKWKATYGTPSQIGKSAVLFDFCGKKCPCTGRDR